MIKPKRELTPAQLANMIDKIGKCEDSQLLRQWIDNAKKRGQSEIEEAAFFRLVEISPADENGPLGADMWKSIHALELALSLERNHTTRLTRTRQKIARVGMQQTLADLALAPKASDGFSMLMSRNMPELTAEAVILRHKDCFSDSVIAAAEARLHDAGVDEPDCL